MKEGSRKISICDQQKAAQLMAFMNVLLKIAENSTQSLCSFGSNLLLKVFFLASEEKSNFEEGARRGRLWEVALGSEQAVLNPRGTFGNAACYASHPPYSKLLLCVPAP